MVNNNFNINNNNILLQNPHLIPYSESYGNNNNGIVYGKNNTTNENIDLYLKNQKQSLFLSKAYLSQENYLSMSPYNSFNSPQYQSQNQIHNSRSQINNYQQNNPNSTDEINVETTNVINETDNYDNNSENNINELNIKKEEEKNVIIDPEHYDFEQNKNEEKKEEDKNEEDDNLSDVSDEPKDEGEFENHLLAQYEKVKRVKEKWKISLKGCIVQKDKKEYVCGKIHGELTRDW